MRIRTPEQQAIIDRFRNNHEESLREFEDAE